MTVCLVSFYSIQRPGRVIFRNTSCVAFSPPFRSELHNPTVTVRHSLILECYLRAKVDHCDNLYKQITALDKLAFVSQLSKMNKCRLDDQVSWSFARPIRHFRMSLLERVVLWHASAFFTHLVYYWKWGKAFSTHGLPTLICFLRWSVTSPYLANM